MVNLTNKELVMLGAFLREGLDCMGGTTLEDLRDDNMTWMSAPDLKDQLGWNSQAIGGVMGSLSDKALIVDSLESARGARETDWYADVDRINEETFAEALNAFDNCEK